MVTSVKPKKILGFDAPIIINLYICLRQGLQHVKPKLLTQNQPHLFSLSYFRSLPPDLPYHQSLKSCFLDCFSTKQWRCFSCFSLSFCLFISGDSSYEAAMFLHRHLLLPPLPPPSHKELHMMSSLVSEDKTLVLVLPATSKML